MNKSDVIYAFSSVTKLAKALDVSRPTIYNWPEQLPQKAEDLIVGAAMRLGIDVTIKEPESLK